MKSIFLFLLTQVTFSVTAASIPQDEYAPDDDEQELPYVVIQYAEDFSAIAQQARNEGKIIMLEVSASYCGYCELLEEEFIKPMLRNEDYAAVVLIRKIDLDSYQTIADFSGNETTPGAFARDLKVTLTPTILFFDGFGNEVSKRILGINSLELFGGYIEDNLNTGLQKIKSK